MTDVYRILEQAKENVSNLNDAINKYNTQLLSSDDLLKKYNDTLVHVKSLIANSIRYSRSLEARRGQLTSDIDDTTTKNEELKAQLAILKDEMSNAEKTLAEASDDVTMAKQDALKKGIDYLLSDLPLYGENNSISANIDLNYQLLDEIIVKINTIQPTLFDTDKKKHALKINLLNSVAEGIHDFSGDGKKFGLLYHSLDKTKHRNQWKEKFVLANLFLCIPQNGLEMWFSDLVNIVRQWENTSENSSGELKMEQVASLGDNYKQPFDSSTLKSRCDDASQSNNPLFKLWYNLVYQYSSNPHDTYNSYSHGNHDQQYTANFFKNVESTTRLRSTVSHKRNEDRLTTCTKILKGIGIYDKVDDKQPALGVIMDTPANAFRNFIQKHTEVPIIFLNPTAVSINDPGPSHSPSPTGSGIGDDYHNTLFPKNYVACEYDGGTGQRQIMSSIPYPRTLIELETHVNNRSKCLINGNNDEFKIGLSDDFHSDTTEPKIVAKITIYSVNDGRQLLSVENDIKISGANPNAITQVIEKIVGDSLAKKNPKNINISNEEDAAKLIIHFQRKARGDGTQVDGCKLYVANASTQFPSKNNWSNDFFGISKNMTVAVYRDEKRQRTQNIAGITITDANTVADYTIENITEPSVSGGSSTAFKSLIDCHNKYKNGLFRTIFISKDWLSTARAALNGVNVMLSSKESEFHSSLLSGGRRPKRQRTQTNSENTPTLHKRKRYNSVANSDSMQGINSDKTPHNESPQIESPQIQTHDNASRDNSKDNTCLYVLNPQIEDIITHFKIDVECDENAVIHKVNAFFNRPETKTILSNLQTNDDEEIVNIVFDNFILFGDIYNELFACMQHNSIHCIMEIIRLQKENTHQTPSTLSKIIFVFNNGNDDEIVEFIVPRNTIVGELLHQGLVNNNKFNREHEPENVDKVRSARKHTRGRSPGKRLTRRKVITKGKPPNKPGVAKTRKKRLGAFMPFMNFYRKSMSAR